MERRGATMMRVTYKVEPLAFADTMACRLSRSFPSPDCENAPNRTFSADREANGGCAPFLLA